MADFTAAQNKKRTVIFTNRGELCKNYQILILLTCLLFVGCASEPPKFDIKNDPPLIQLPADDQQSVITPRPGEDTPFQDISLADKKRLYTLTNKAEIEKDVNQYVDNGQADVITRPDGTIEFPYGLTEAIITAKKMMYSKIVLQEGEKITNISVGDNVRWHITSNYIGDANDYTPVVLIKPFLAVCRQVYRSRQTNVITILSSDQLIPVILCNGPVSITRKTRRMLSMLAVHRGKQTVHQTQLQDRYSQYHLSLCCLRR